MTTHELWRKVNSNDADLLFNLWERWQDEKDYEDIQDYLLVIQKSIPEAFKITKRPFGIVCKCEDGNIHIFVKKVSDYIKLAAKKVA